MFNLIIAGIAIVMGYFMINARRRKWVGREYF
jgi:hypothetical protein